MVIGPVFDKLVEQILAAYETGAVVDFPEELEERDGREIGRIVAGRRFEAGEEIIGWKVGAVAPAVQQKFGLAAPLVGAVFARSLQPRSFARMHRPAVEVEAVVRLDAELNVAEVRSGLELVDFHFDGPVRGSWALADHGCHAGASLGHPLEIDDAPVKLRIPGERAPFSGVLRRVPVDPATLVELVGPGIDGRPYAPGDWIWSGNQLGGFPVPKAGAIVLDVDGLTSSLEIHS